MVNVSVADRTVNITNTVVGIFRQHRQLKEKETERGGIVLGQVTENENHILVCRASVSSDPRWSTRHSFLRQKGWAQEVANYEFYNSDGKNTYLGEWHTHPSSQIVPSPRDIYTIRQQFALNVIRTHLLLLIIVGWEEIYVGLYDGRHIVSQNVREVFTQGLRA